MNLLPSVSAFCLERIEQLRRLKPEPPPNAIQELQTIVDYCETLNRQAELMEGWLGSSPVMPEPGVPATNCNAFVRLANDTIHELVYACQHAQQAADGADETEEIRPVLATIEANVKELRGIAGL